MSTQIPSSIDLRKYLDTAFFEERPHIRGRRVPVAHIVNSALANGWTVERTAYNFTLSEAEVLAAMLYYKENKEEIDRQEEEENAKFDEMKRLHEQG
jgi:uncharacterized protein (DUF433 family)